MAYQSRNQSVAAAGLAALIALGSATGAVAETTRVSVDEALIIRLKQPGATVIVGNPSIADVSVQGSKLLVITGKSFGTTNLIVLNNKGKEVLDRTIVVSADSRRMVTLRKGAARMSYNCSPTCQPALVVGDSHSVFQNLNKQIQGKMQTSQSSAESGSSN